MTSQRIPALIVVALLFIVTVVAVFLWNEARKEVIFLCGNFAAGDSRQSVVEQLDTANLAGYKVITMPGGSRLEFESDLNFEVDKCVIELDSEGLVERVGTR